MNHARAIGTGLGIGFTIAAYVGWIVFCEWFADGDIWGLALILAPLFIGFGYFIEDLRS